MGFHDQIKYHGFSYSDIRRPISIAISKIRGLGDIRFFLPKFDAKKYFFQIPILRGKYLLTLSGRA